MNTTLKIQQHKEAFEIDVKKLLRETNTKGVVLIRIEPIETTEIKINNSIYNASKPFVLESQFHPITNAFFKIKIENTVKQPLIMVRYLLVTK